MVAHSKVAAFTNWVAAAVAAIMVFAIGCVAGYQAQDSFGQPPMWIVFGGNGDPGDGNGGGFAASEVVRVGWTSADRVFQVKYPADVSKMEQSTQAAMGPGRAAYSKMCGSGCIIAGFSQGTDPAIELSRQVGHPGSGTVLFAGPQPQSGIWHHYAPESSFVEPFLQQSGFPTNRVPLPGTRHFFSQADIYANAAPQCSNWPVLSYMGSGTGQFHRIVGPDETFSVWTDAFGVEQHEVDDPVAFSGNEPTPIFQGCPWGDWRNGLR